MFASVFAFIKKNWLVLSIMILTTVGFILSIINVTTTGILHPAARPDFMGNAVSVAYMLFFLGITIYLTCGLLGLSKSVRAYVILATGLAVTVFMTIGLIHVIDNWEDAFAFLRMQNNPPIESEWSRFIIFPVVIQLFVFGLFPLLFGLQRLFRARQEKKEKPAITEQPVEVQEEQKEQKDTKTKKA